MSRIRSCNVFLMGLLFVSVAPSNGLATLTAGERAQQAVAAYDEAMSGSERDARLEGFRRAERLFASLVDDGYENAALYTNLGNAALQAERLGPAILAYKRALLLEPGSERARQNLEHARGLLPDWVPTPPEGGILDSFFFWHSSTAPEAREQLAAACFALAMLCVCGAIYFRAASLRYAAAPFALIWIALVASLVFDPTRAAAAEAVLSQTTVARAADSINAPRRFADDLPSGTEVRILEDRGGWLQIELYNGRNGWITSSAVVRVGRS